MDNQKSDQCISETRTRPISALDKLKIYRGLAADLDNAQSFDELKRVLRVLVNDAVSDLELVNKSPG